MDLSTYLAVLRRWWLTLLVATSVAALVGYVLASQVQPTYESRARVLVGPINGDVDTIRASSFLVLTYGELIESDEVLQDTITTLGLDTTVADLRDDVDTAANDETRFLTIRARSDDPVEAAAVTQALVDRLVELATRETRRPEGALQVINAAEVDESTVSPRVPILVALAALAGLLGAIIVVAIAEMAGGTIRTRRELAAAVPLESIGEVGGGSHSWTRASGSAPWAPPRSTVARQYREAVTRLLLARPEGPPRVVVVLGTAPGDAAALVATNLANSLAKAGHPVALVDADDVDRPVTKLFDADKRAGLADPELPLGSILSVRDDFDVVPAGVASGGPDMPVDRYVRTLLERAQVVVVSAAPLGRTASTMAWLRIADLTVVAVRRFRTRQDALVDAADAIQAASAGPVVTLLHEEEPRAGRDTKDTAGTGRDATRRRALRDQRIIRAGTGTSTPGQHDTP